MRRILMVVAMTAVAALALAQQPKEYSAAEAAKHVGEEATITDVVTGVHQSRAGHIFLNMGGKYPNQAFTAFVPKDSADQFPNAKEFDGHRVAITGKIVLY